jgi:hypothetical protein
MIKSNHIFFLIARGGGTWPGETSATGSKYAGFLSVPLEYCANSIKQQAWKIRERITFKCRCIVPFLYGKGFLFF